MKVRFFAQTLRRMPGLGPVLLRGCVVWIVTPWIALTLWSLSGQVAPFSYSLVYSYAISTAIWLLADPLYHLLHCRRHKQTGSQGLEWSVQWVGHLLLSMVVGYVVGTLIGDAYAGHSTWKLLALAPRRFWGFLVASVGISAVFAAYFYQQERTRHLQQQASEARLRLLQSQLEPHMLFNTLANLRALIPSSPTQALTMLDCLNDYLRAALSATRALHEQHPHTLGQEIELLKNYLELMAVRMGPRLRFECDVPAHLHAQPTLPLLLQPLVENAIRHGLEPQVSGGTICLQARCRGAQLHITLTDNGAGGAHWPPVKQTATQPMGGMGLHHVRERLHTRYGTQAHMALHSPPGQGTRITLQWPLQ